MGGDIRIMVCVDCLMWIANGEGNPDWTEEDEAQFLADLNERWPADKWWLACGDSEHDHDFSWSQCDGCGSKLGGSRHEAWAFEREVKV